MRGRTVIRGFYLALGFSGYCFKLSPAMNGAIDELLIQRQTIGVRRQRVWLLLSDAR